MNKPVRRVRRADVGGIWRVDGTCGPFWSIGFGAKRSGGGRREFGAWAGTDILGHPARELRNLQGKLTRNGDRSSSGLVPPKNG